MEPNFFIIGAAKSGTTSLAYNLVQHPEIFISPVKEPFYFVSDAGLNDFNKYISLFKTAGDAKAVGEASSGYLYDEYAPLAIHKQFPAAKIIAILRNPPEMAFSYWQYMKVWGNESKSFEDAISYEEREYRKSEAFKREALGWWAMYVYLERAMYFQQVRRYLNIFGRGNVKVYIFEEFFKYPQKSFRDVFTFLGVDPDFTPNNAVKNEGGVTRSSILKKIRDRKYPLLKRLLPFTLRRKLRLFLLDVNTKRGSRVTMNPDTRDRLIAFFEDDIRNLEQLLGYDINTWKKRQVQTAIELF